MVLQILASLIGVAVIGLILSAIILPLLNHFRIERLKKETRTLRNTVQALITVLENKGIKSPNEVWPDEENGFPPSLDEPWEPAGHAPGSDAEPPGMPAPLMAEPVPEPAIGLERKFGALLPVWVGGIALSFAGFFLIRYSIENDLLNPAVRVALSGLLGAGLLYASHRVRNRPDFPNGVRIAQALSGAGIAVLYVCLFAAVSLYELIPSSIGFIAMAAVTALAVVLALRHGLPIAMLGLVGGFLTPALISTSQPSAPLLFIYLLMVYGGLMHVIKRRNWWILSIPALLGSFLWVIFWIFSVSAMEDTIWLALFLAGVSGTIVYYSRERYAEDVKTGGWKLGLNSILNCTGLGGGLVLMSIIAVQADFGATEWTLFGLLTAGGIGLAVFNDKLYGFVPCASMVVNLIMLFAWEQAQAGSFALTLTAFAILYAGSGYFLMWRAHVPLLWAGLTAAAGLGFYLLAYYRLHNAGLFAGIPLFWGSAALILCALSIHVLRKILKRHGEHPHKEHILTIFVVTATAFSSLALTIELEYEFLSVAIAIEVLVLSWINQRTSIRSLRAVSLALAAVFGFLLLPQLVVLLNYATHSLLTSALPQQDPVPLVRWPVFQLGVPAGLFLLAARLLRRQRDGASVFALEAAATGLGAVMIYWLTRHAFHDETELFKTLADFSQGGLINNLLFIYVLACFHAGRLGKRAAFSWSAIVLGAFIMLRVCYFDLIVQNPLWSHEQIKGWYLLNSLLPSYGLPLVWLWLAGRELKHMGRASWLPCLQGAMLVLLFALLSLNVRHVFHGEYLDGQGATNAEVYTYSAVWLLLGAGLLIAGALKKNKALRYSSLVIILLVIGKVFLYDAAALEGLYRVLSFFGLGFSLLALSYIYTRFIFSNKSRSPPLVQS